MALHIQIMPVTPFRQNCSLLWDDESGEAVLIDVGGDAEYLAKAVVKQDVQLKALWLTHGHLDHAGGVVAFRQLNDVAVIGPHADDLFLLEKLPEITAQYGFPISPAFTPERWLNEGDVVNVGCYEFQVLHIPGHTPGHVVFYCAAEKLLIAGDVLFYESVGRTDFERSNTDDLLNGIATKLYKLPDDVRVIAGHGRTTTIGHEKRFNPFIRA